MIKKGDWLSVLLCGSSFCFNTVSYALDVQIGVQLSVYTALKSIENAQVEDFRLFVGPGVVALYSRN